MDTMQTYTPLVEKCKRLKRAMRIGTNHGSLSARILSYYGDTPRGMVESAFEFADICRYRLTLLPQASHESTVALLYESAIKLGPCLSGFIVAPFSVVLRCCAAAGRACMQR